MTLFLSKSYGGTRLGHQNSLELLDRMKKELGEVHYNEFFLGGYYYCTGNKL